jgi:hypothetical protein
MHLILLFYYLSLLNLADAALTVTGIENSLITEGNPLMERLYSLGPELFIVVKILLSMILLLFVFSKKVPESRLTKNLTLFAAACYTAVIAVHSFWLFQLI